MQKKSIIKYRKWEVVYENDYTISTWKYNSKISLVNPVEVSIKYKNDTEPIKKQRKKN